MDNVVCISICLHTETVAEVRKPQAWFSLIYVTFCITVPNRKCVYALTLLPVCIFDFDLYPSTLKENRQNKSAKKSGKGFTLGGQNWPKVSLGRNSFGTQKGGTSETQEGGSFVFPCFVFVCFLKHKKKKLQKNRPCIFSKLILVKRKLSQNENQTVIVGISLVRVKTLDSTSFI